MIGGHGFTAAVETPILDRYLAGNLPRNAMNTQKRIKHRLSVTARARRLLKEKHSFYNTWSDVAGELGMNKGFLNAVSNGKKKPSKILLGKLGLSRHRDLWSMPVALLAFKIRNREEMPDV